MGQIEWAMWANQQAFTSAIFMVIGGIIALPTFDPFGVGVFTLVAGVVIFIFEYPRSKRRKGTNRPRWFQHYISDVLKFLGPVSSNYYLRSGVYFVCSVPQVFTLPTLINTVCLLVASALYFTAAVKDEKWQPVPYESQERKTPLKVKEVPSRPPPRNPVGAENTGFDDITVEIS